MANLATLIFLSGHLTENLDLSIFFNLKFQISLVKSRDHFANSGCLKFEFYKVG